MKQITLTFIFLSFIVFSSAQGTIWQSVESQSLNAVPPSDRPIVPLKYDLYQIDPSALSQKLIHAVDRFEGGAAIRVDFPLGQDLFETFNVYKSGAMEPALETAYPNVRSYYGYSQSNSLNKIYFTITPQGFRGLITGSQIFYMDPYAKSAANTIMIYNRGNISRGADDSFECHVQGSLSPGTMDLFETTIAAKAFRDRIFRTYRIAIATTSEYTSYHNDGNAANGDARADALAAIVTTVTRVNSVYEQEMSMRFTLVANNDRLIYFQGQNNLGSSDPYDNYSGSQMLGANTTNINNRIGSGSYDIGHVFSTGGGGIAGRSPCESGKGQGVTGIVTPEFDPFDIDYVCHEIGHQYGADHTFYNGCFGGSPSPQPYESGSASTIMGYAGICAPNVQDNSDAYFHLISLFQMQNSIDGDTCEVETSLGSNNASAPNSLSLTNKTIPKSTPFKLVGASSVNADANDSYTYNWEQLDTGAAAATGSAQPPLPANTTGPMFRSKFATEDATRYFPNLSDLVGGIDPTWETLPSAERDMRFFCTIRDNNPFGGQTSYGSVTLTVGAAGPVVIASPAGGETWYEGQSRTITWNVNGTNNSTYATQVNIKLSTDGGYTYPITLANNVSNSGSQSVTIPTGVLTRSARVMVEAVDNYFFNISPANFTIKEGTFELTAVNDLTTACAPANASFTFSYDAAPGFNQSVNFTAVGLPSGINPNFSVNNTTTDVTVNVTLQGTAAVNAGQYAFKVRAASTGVTIEKDFTLKIFDGNVGDVVLVTPINGASNQPVNTLLSWDDLASASSYIVEISNTSSFTTILESASLTNTTTYIPTMLSAGAVYYWRVRPSNGCTAGAVTSIGSFQTAQDVCITYDNETYVNEAQPAGIANQRQWNTSVNAVSAIVNIPDDIEITNVSFYMKATHDDTGHIKMQFSAPTGRFSEVYNRECAAGRNFDLVVSDQGTQNFGCAPGFTGALTGNQRPGQAFSRFNGLSAQGEWVLLATDRTATVGGTFDEFAVTVCGRLQYVNDIDVNRNLGITSPYNATTTIDNSVLRAQKSGEATTAVVFVVTKLPAYGNLKNQGAALVLGDTFTQADVDANRISYLHNATSLDYNDTFEYAVRATNNILSSGNVFPISIEEPTLIYNNTSWAPFAPTTETGSLNAIVQSGTASLTTAASVKDLQVIAGANSLMLSAQLTVSGNMDVAGTLDARSGGHLILDGTSQQQINGTASASIMTEDLTITNNTGVVLNTPVDAYGVVTATNASLTTNGNLTFKSNATRTAQFSDATGTTITGSVKVERYIPAKRAFRFLASSVNTAGSIYQNWQENGASTAGLGIHITGSSAGANGFDATSSGNASMFGYDNDNQNWFGVANTNVNTLQVGEAWRALVRGDRTTNITTASPTATNTILRAQGTLHTGDFTASYGTAAGEFAFLANPYQAAIDLKTVLNNATTQGINANYVYMWDPNLNINGAYATVDMSTLNGTAVPATSTANKYAQPGQSFFVQTTGASSITYSESDKETNAAQTSVFSTPAPATRITVSLLDAQSGELRDEAVTSFSGTHTNVVDANDAIKFNNIDETLSILQQGTNLAIEKRDIPQNTETTELHIAQYRGNSYIFDIAVENLNGLQAILVDRFLNMETALAAGSNQIAFNVNAQNSGSANRFAIKYTTGQLSLDTTTLQQDVRVYPNPSTNGNFEISSSLLVGEQASIKMYNALGQLVHSQDGIYQSTIAVRPQSQLSTGTYIVRIGTATQQAAIQILVK
jgi:hypothetical protein